MLPFLQPSPTNSALLFFQAVWLPGDARAWLSSVGHQGVCILGTNPELARDGPRKVGLCSSCLGTRHHATVTQLAATSRTHFQGVGVSETLTIDVGEKFAF